MAEDVSGSGGIQNPYLQAFLSSLQVPTSGPGGGLWASQTPYSAARPDPLQPNARYVVGPDGYTYEVKQPTQADVDKAIADGKASELGIGGQILGVAKGFALPALGATGAYFLGPELAALGSGLGGGTAGLGAVDTLGVGGDAFAGAGGIAAEGGTGATGLLGSGGFGAVDTLGVGGDGFAGAGGISASGGVGATAPGAVDTLGVGGDGLGVTDGAGGTAANGGLGATSAAGGAPSKAGTPLSRLLNGTADAADYATMGLQALPGVLGAVGANQQANALSSLSNQYMAIGAPSRARYEAAMTPGFNPTSIPGYSGALDSASQSVLSKLSTQGNPYGNPGGLIEANKQIVNGTALPAIQNYESQNAATGGYANFNASAPSTAQQAIGSQGGVLNALGSSVSSVVNPPQTLADLLKQYGLGSGSQNQNTRASGASLQ